MQFVRLSVRPSTLIGLEMLYLMGLVDFTLYLWVLLVMLQLIFKLYVHISLSFLRSISLSLSLSFPLYLSLFYALSLSLFYALTNFKLYLLVLVDFKLYLLDIWLLSYTLHGIQTPYL